VTRDRLPVQGFRGTPEEIERQWCEQVYRGRGDSLRQLTWRAVVMGSMLGGVLSLTNLIPGLGRRAVDRCDALSSSVTTKPGRYSSAA